MSKTIQTKVKLRNDTAANWTSNNPTLAAGEIGIETDTNKFKLGNGSTAWKSLAYGAPETWAGSSSQGGVATKAASIPFGEVDSTSTSTVFTATVPGIESLEDGVCVYLKNGVVTSASGFTLNINNLGAKQVYSSLAAQTAATTIFNVNYTMLFIYNSSRISGGCWDIFYGYNSDTTMAHGYLAYSFRPYAGQAIYRYKLVMQGADNRLYPIVTTNQTSTTQVAKVPTTIGLRPYKIWYYNSSTTINAGGVVGTQLLVATCGSTTMPPYNFNESIPAYRMVYLRGTYNKDTDLFTLYNDGNSPCKSYYTFVPTNTANINLATYFVSGYYYLLVGGSYSTSNSYTLFDYNKLYYFDGTNLIPFQTKITEDLMPTKTSQLTNDSGFITSADVPEGSVASSTTPKMNGTAAVGTQTAFARGDHVHPSDTSRVPTTRTVNGKALSSNITLSASDVGALASDAITTVTETFSYDGLTITAKRTGNVAQVIVRGTSTSSFTTKSAYITPATLSSAFIPDGGFISIGYINPTYYGQLNVTSAGVLQIGYSKKVSDGSTIDLPSGINFYVKINYILG